MTDQALRLARSSPWAHRDRRDRSRMPPAFSAVGADDDVAPWRAELLGVPAGATLAAVIAGSAGAPPGSTRPRRTSRTWPLVLRARNDRR
jgi:hypothetical protein